MFLRNIIKINHFHLISLYKEVTYPELSVVLFHIIQY